MLDTFLGGGGGGRIEFANFSTLTTKLLVVFSMDVTILSAKSAPGMVGGLASLVGGPVSAPGLGRVWV